MAVFMVFISVYLAFSFFKSLTCYLLDYRQFYFYSDEIDLEKIQNYCHRIEDASVYKYTNEIFINIGIFRLILAFIIIECKGTEDIIQGLSKLDDILKISVF